MTDDFAVVRNSMEEFVPSGDEAFDALDRIEARLNVLAGYTERIEARCKAGEASALEWSMKYDGAYLDAATAEAERDKARVDAERLAEALRGSRALLVKYPELLGFKLAAEVARAALAAYEEGK